ncbi:MAG: AraC family transcriptional regulator [Prevotella sp.]|nr:AraC family transcriptional regulator [Prevotella sp.]
MPKDNNIQPISIERVTSTYKLPHLNNEIVLIDSSHSTPLYTEPRRMSLCLYIGVCTNGVVSLTVNGKHRLQSNNQVMLITEESVITDVKISDDYKGFAFLISYRLLQEILRDVHNMSDLFLLSHNHPIFSLNEEELYAAKNYFRSIRSHITQTDKRYRTEIIRLTLLTMIYDMAGAFDRVIEQPGKNEKQSRAEQLFVEFVQRVEHHYHEERQVQWYAKQMNVTPKYLCEVVSNVSRRTPNEWIDKFVTSEMRNLLRHTNMRMSEIAEVMNFPTQSFFGKYFKENVGVTPSEYRNGIEP